ncbi:MAG: NUDIX domain-containing protein [Alphaproteobacteria bacterium]|jgi:8-oxo-dGTP diphosphatase|nr:NUDIX domain-containing protein [Alphaproteobacteria bacterium]
MIRRYGERDKAGMHYTRRPGAYAILFRGPDVLLTFQAGIHNEYQLPGGGIDPGESPIQALHREVYEETGWHIARPMRIGTYRRFAYMPEYDLWAEKIAMIYLAFPTRQVRSPTEPDHSAVWLPRHQAPNRLANDGDAAFLASLL